MPIYEDLKCKIVLLTGGANGIGEATVREFCLQGAIVHFCDLDVAAGKKLAKELPAWAKDAPRVKGRAPKKGASASSGSAGARSAANGSAVSIELSGITPSPATLFVVITGS